MLAWLDYAFHMSLSSLDFILIQTQDMRKCKIAINSFILVYLQLIHVHTIQILGWHFKFF